MALNEKKVKGSAKLFPQYLAMEIHQRVVEAFHSKPLMPTLRMAFEERSGAPSKANKDYNSYSVHLM